MVTPEDSLVAPVKRSPLRPVLIAAAIVGLAGAAWWMFGRGKGQPEDPARVLIVGPTPELAGYLERKGFDVDHLSFGAAVGEGQALDPSLDELAAVVEYADQHGFGYLALNMAHGERYAFADADYEAAEPPPGTTFAVLSIGDLGNHVSYGGVPLGVAHEHPLDEQIGMLLALFDQPEIAKARTREADNDLMIRFGSAGTVEDVVELEKAHENMRRQIAAWDALAEKERGEPKPLELARPYEQLHGWPLANGKLLLGAAHAAWRSPDGLQTTWDAHDATLDLRVVAADSLAERGPCESLPDTLEPGEFAIAPEGDALLIPSNAYVAELWTLSGDGCGFERRDEIRRLAGGELGQPRASGRTAAVRAGRLEWADLKMRAYRNARFAGVELRPDALRWVSDDIVVIPAQLDFVAAAEDQRSRARAALVEAGLPAPELEPVDPSTVPSERAAVVFVRLPAPDQQGVIELAVVPIDALASGDSSALNLRTAQPIAGDEPTVVVQLDTAAGIELTQLSLAAAGPAWQNGLAPEFELGKAAEAGRAAVQTKRLAGELPPTASNLVVSPTGSHAAWSAPVGIDALDEAFEIFVLALGAEGAEPIRMTDNDRPDMDPMFAGPDGRLLLFYSEYQADEKLPAVDTLRAIAIP